MRDDKSLSRQSLEAARLIGRAETDSRVDDLKLKLGIRSGEHLKADVEPTHACQD